jgi:hypothetical protein
MITIRFWITLPKNSAFSDFDIDCWKSKLVLINYSRKGVVVNMGESGLGDNVPYLIQFGSNKLN